MNQYVKRTQRDYSLSLKLAIVEQIEKGEMTYLQAQERYGIQGSSTVLNWLRKYGQLEWRNNSSPILRRGFMHKLTPQTPEQRIKELEQKLAESEVKAQFFEAVVKVMNTEFGATLNKKAVSHIITQAQTPRLTVARVCLFMGISRQAWYQSLRRECGKEIQFQSIIKQVTSIRLQQPRLGTRKLHYLLQQQLDPALHIGRDRLFQILRYAQLLVIPKRAYYKITNSHHCFHRHPNLLKSGVNQVVASHPEQVWVADITYLPLRKGTAYISLVTDILSRKIVGYHVHESLHTHNVSMAFKMALAGRRKDSSLVHHSDRGIQYCSTEYQKLHERHGVICSMTDGYDCYQNALAERVNGILKMEYLLVKPEDISQARKMLKEAVEIYNTQRPHLSLKYKTPDEVHRAF
ncbi:MULTISPECIES: IS3 family transposase [Providencia]|uniref:IS3 family transposase n=1 Tax=Providencia TaxID=586 RepID=UPI0012E94491|nr:IS3 family transposase [Providencia heimbachae]MBP6121258.1 IS3 family transposase [Providencia sp.]NIH22850.1 IS3 family transposase [Providencia heimbachae]